MQSIRNILVPTDFSDGSRRCVEYAADLAKALGARLTLLHVFHLATPAYGESVYAAFVDDIPSLLKSCEAGLQVERDAVERLGVEAGTLLVQGDPASEIAEAARAQKADLVVVATHGRRGMAHALMGSVAERVVRLSSVPVMTVHAFAESGTAPP